MHVLRERHDEVAFNTEAKAEGRLDVKSRILAKPFSPETESESTKWATCSEQNFSSPRESMTAESKADVPTQVKGLVPGRRRSISPA